ncbi:MAG: Asp23/Gls24 family envelope stress response protein [Oscillospiraceae bacterium]|nr:Asp23/Gls24 family envelope stress response protein [Oscillospiraceae bacterium]
MLSIKNHIGEITVSEQFFTELIGGTVAGCFGVAGMGVAHHNRSFADLLPFIKRENPQSKGVFVKVVGNKLRINIHISVIYGVNLASIVKSIQHKVRYAVEEAVDLSAEQVNVFIDGLYYEDYKDYEYRGGKERGNN